MIAGGTGALIGVFAPDALPAPRIGGGAGKGGIDALAGPAGARGIMPSALAAPLLAPSTSCVCPILAPASSTMGCSSPGMAPNSSLIAPSLLDSRIHVASRGPMLYTECVCLHGWLALSGPPEQPALGCFL